MSMGERGHLPPLKMLLCISSYSQTLSGRIIFALFCVLTIAQHRFILINFLLFSALSNSVRGAIQIPHCDCDCDCDYFHNLSPLLGADPRPSPGLHP